MLRNFLFTFNVVQSIIVIIIIFRKIKAFLREQTGLVNGIHIIQESAARGSILSTDETQVNHDRAAPGEDDLHLQLAYVSSLFVYHFAANWKVGYMMNYPGDYNGKIANYVCYFKLFVFLLVSIL